MRRSSSSSSPSLIPRCGAFQLGFWSLLPYGGRVVPSPPSSWFGASLLDRKSAAVKSSFFFFAKCSFVLLPHCKCFAFSLNAAFCVECGRRCGEAHLLRGSYRGEIEVVVDLHQWDVKLGDLKDTGGLVRGRVQLLELELPLQTLHGVQGRCLVLLPHQETRLPKGNGQ